MNTLQTLDDLRRQAALGQADTKLTVVSPPSKSAAPLPKVQ
ncbi:MAG: hypothetical protein QMB17_09285 [Polaromonas sp.]